MSWLTRHGKKCATGGTLNRVSAQVTTLLGAPTRPQRRQLPKLVAAMTQVCRNSPMLPVPLLDEGGSPDNRP